MSAPHQPSHPHFENLVADMAAFAIKHGITWAEALTAVRRQMVTQALQKGGDHAAAARILGVHRNSAWRMDNLKYTRAGRKRVTK